MAAGFGNTCYARITVRRAIKVTLDGATFYMRRAVKCMLRCYATRGKQVLRFDFNVTLRF